MTLFRPLSAFATAVVAAVAENLFGPAVDAVYPALGVSARAAAGVGAEVFPPLVGAASALLLVALPLWPHLPGRRRGLQTCPGATRSSACG